jgi:hypothetical protein
MIAADACLIPIATSAIGYALISLSSGEGQPAL